ncbi:ABC transporter permease (plasmid) [Mycetohabitans rhizoxinica]|jgi:osmoprotectant transport system permease protein|nr:MULTISPECIES: ABC transporter permease [Mycetohabitans]MCF7697435.1 ABC transporter permease [Mycetohabitans sp. B2]MCG1048295.1 ABC transporter permease [Mycetohabitans sp. B6]
MTSRRAKLLSSFIVLTLIVTALVRAIGLDVLCKYHADLLYYTGAHLLLVGASIALALLTGIPAGILLSRASNPRHAERLMQVLNVGNTVPSLAVLALALAVLGIGAAPAIVALWLASLLPIARNAYEGMRAVPPAWREAARGLGMTSLQSMFKVELPNAMPIIIGGVRTALAINVGTAPLAFLIGADSLGTLIFPGIYLNDPAMLLLGAASTAALALALDALVAGIARAALARRGLAL